MESYKTDTHRRLIHCSIVITAYLLGLLMVDIQMDLTGDQSELKSYYCALTGSLASPVGIVRMGIPVLTSSLIQLSLCRSLSILSDRRLQRMITALLVFVGMPSVGVSIATCISVCTQNNSSNFEAFSVVRMTHYVMWGLFVFCICIQSYIGRKRS
jgi:hypothetical protein